MPICITCTHPISHLYTVYESAYNLRLEQCVGARCYSFWFYSNARVTGRANAWNLQIHMSNTTLWRSSWTSFYWSEKCIDIWYIIEGQSRERRSGVKLTLTRREVGKVSTPWLLPKADKGRKWVISLSMIPLLSTKLVGQMVAHFEACLRAYHCRCMYVNSSTTSHCILCSFILVIRWAHLSQLYFLFKGCRRFHGH